MIDKTSRILAQSRDENIARIKVDPNLSEEEKNAQISSVINNYASGLRKADTQAKALGNMTLGLNIPILTLDNFFTFGKFYSKGFDNAKANLKNNVKTSVSDLAN